MAYAIVKFSLIVIFCCCKSCANVEDVMFKIIGGSHTKIDNYPFLGCLMYHKTPRCGSTLISNRHVVTAAHCILDTTPCGLTVRFGSSFNYRGGKVYQVIKTMQHKLYNTTTKEHDIAVLKLDQKVDEEYGIPIGIADYRTKIEPGMLCQIMGWGTENAGDSKGSVILKSVKVPIVSRQECEDAYMKVKRKITKNMICAGDMRVGGTDSCQGDSGGPMIYGHLLVGVTSFGRGCGDKRFPGVYVRMPNYIPFMYECVDV